MKKNWLAVVLSLGLVLVVSVLFSQFLLPMFNFRTYSETNCLTQTIPNEASLGDIAKKYRDGKATVAIQVYVPSKEIGALGSGVVIASKGYVTNMNYTASKGSYIATNYHVIDMFDSKELAGYQKTLTVMVESEQEYNAELLWFDKDLDLAIIYCEENFNYVSMADRWLFCSEEEKIDIDEDIFTVGTPLDIGYLNRFTKGNIASNNSMVMATEDLIYANIASNSYNIYDDSGTAMYVLSNVYEDVLDVSLGITSGNSGGGCFDENGFLIGLTTLGGNVEETGGNQMNGVVPIYPVMEVIDRVIVNNETNASHKIYDLKSIGLVGVDATEAYLVDSYKEYAQSNYYFLDGNFYSSSYSSAFGFEYEGYCVVKTDYSKEGLNISHGSYITAIQINANEIIEIKDRNDLVYALLQTREKESGKSSTITFKYVNSSSFITSSQTITL